MFKKLSTLLTLTLILSASVSINPASAQSTLTAQDVLDKYVFNAGYSYTVIFPKSWEGYKSTATTQDFGEHGTAEARNFGIEGKGDMLFITAHTKEQWQNIVYEGGLVPILLGETDDWVFAYNVANDYMENREDQMDAIPWIVNHISINESTLSDIMANDYEKAIQYLYNENVISGYDDGTFKPNQVVNRAELMKIIVESVFGTPDEETYLGCFPDVQEDWYAKYVCYAKEQNWIQGYPDGTFLPDQNINKAEALKILVNAYGYTIPGAVNDELFKDVDTSAWYAPFVKTANDKGLLPQSYEGADLTTINYGIGEEITRGEVSENIYRAILLNLVDPNSSAPDGIMETDTTEDDTATDEPVATMENYSVFVSESFKFQMEYPALWFYGSVDTDDENVIRRYEFGADPVDEVPGIVSLELRAGEAPDGTIVTQNGKTLVKVPGESEVNVYYKAEEGTRLYRLTGPAAYEETLLAMASTIEKVEVTEEADNTEL